MVLARGKYRRCRAQLLEKRFQHAERPVCHHVSVGTHGPELVECGRRWSHCHGRRRACGAYRSTAYAVDDGTSTALRFGREQVSACARPTARRSCGQLQRPSPSTSSVRVHTGSLTGAGAPDKASMCSLPLADERERLVCVAPAARHSSPSRVSTPTSR